FRRLRDPRQARLVLVAAHVFGALELDHRLFAVESDDDLDVGLPLERLRDPTAPERPEAGDQDSLAHALAEPDRSTLTQHLVERLLDLLADRFRVVHHLAARVARLVRGDIE